MYRKISVFGDLKLGCGLSIRQKRVNHWLWNSLKLPFTGTVLQSTCPCNTPACRMRWGRCAGPVRGRWSGWSVGGIKFQMLFSSGAQIHSLGRRAFQAVGSANCVISVSIPRTLRLAT